VLGGAVVVVVSGGTVVVVVDGGSFATKIFTVLFFWTSTPAVGSCDMTMLGGTSGVSS
jgi:hypothetical protein